MKQAIALFVFAGLAAPALPSTSNSRDAQKDIKIAQSASTFEGYLTKIRGAVNNYIDKAITGDATAQKRLAEFYCEPFRDLPVENSLLVKKEYATEGNCSSKGLAMLRQLARNGDAEAQFLLASILRSEPGKTVAPVDDKEAFSWYMQLAGEAPPSLKSEGFAPRSYKASAAAWVALFYKDGISVPKNLEAALHWYQVAISIDGDPSDVIEVAHMFAKGEGTKQNTAEAIRLLSSIPQEDHVKFKLGEVYLIYDEETPDRYEKARHIFELLHRNAEARTERHESAYYLGFLYYHGYGTKRDYRTAFDYLI